MVFEIRLHKLISTGIVILMLSLFLINGIYAQDTLDNSLLQNDENPIAENDFTSIQVLIDNAFDGDSISLDNDVYLGQGNPINIDKSITINGNGARLDAQSKSNIFTVSKDARVNIVGLTLTNGNSKEGGAIRNSGVLNIEDCSFSSNSATYAGALYNEGLSTVTDTKFTLNEAFQGAAIVSLFDIVVSNCEFEKNVISHSYGVISIENGLANISDSIFRYNEGSDEGCCVFNKKTGNVSIINSKFIKNTAYSYGGAINNDGLMAIKDCLFDSNSAGDAGTIDNGGTLTIINSNFTKSTVGKNGGAIDSNGKLDILNCIFEGNVAEAQGGAIIARGDINVCNSSFIDNLAGEADAIYINDGIEYSINDNWWGANNPDFSKLLNVNLTEDYSWITHSSKLYAHNLTTSEGNGVKLIISLQDDESNPISDAVISVRLNSADYKLMTDEEGKAYMDIVLAPGRYVAVISYAGSDEMMGSGCMATIVVNEDDSKKEQSGNGSFIPENEERSNSKDYGMQKANGLNAVGKYASGHYLRTLMSSANVVSGKTSGINCSNVSVGFDNLDFISYLIDFIKEFIRALFEKLFYYLNINIKV